MLSCRGWGKLSRPVYLAPPHPLGYRSKIILLILLISIYLIVKIVNLKHNSSQIQLISLSDCSVYLVTGVGGKLSRPGYLDPHPPEYQSNFFAKFSHFKLSERDDVSIINIIQGKFSCFSLSDCSVCLVAGVGGKLSRPIYLAPPPPTHLGIEVKLFY